MPVEQKQSIVVFFSYAERDKLLRNRLEEHLSNLKYRGLITTWHNREILAGMDWQEQIDIALHSAQIILLLISSAFMASDYCYGKEMQKALQLHAQKRAAVIPILLRPVLFTDAPFARLAMLPTNGKPVTKWHDRDSAFVNVALSIEKVIRYYLQDKTAKRFTPTENVQVKSTTSADVLNVAEERVSDRKKCPYCNNADIRSGDNFCLNCGLRLPASGDALPGVSSPVTENWISIPAPAETSMAVPTIRSESSATIENPARVILRTDGGETLQEFVLDKPEFSLGRAPSSDIHLSKGKRVSRRHATIHYENGAYFLSDERSANGTFMNGQQLEEKIPYKLQDGDYVGIGEYEMLFHSSQVDIESLPTMVVNVENQTYATRENSFGTIATSDEFGTRPWNPNEAENMVIETAESAPGLSPITAEFWNDTPKGVGEATDTHHHLIVEAIQRAYYTESIFAYEQALRNHPKDNEALLGMGRALYRLARYDEAFDAFQQSLLYQTSPSAYSGLADVCVKRKRYDEAVTAYEKALQLDLDTALSYTDFIYALEMIGKIDEAAQMRKKAEEVGYFDDESEILK